MYKYLKIILPSATTAVICIFLPLALSIYFLVNTYSNNLVTNPNIDLTELPDSSILNFFLARPWVGLLSRLTDFILWGVLAGICIVGYWLISNAKTSVENHYSQESFTNFKISKKTWHGNFIIVGFIRVLLIVLIIMLLNIALFKAIPELSRGFSSVVANGYIVDNIVHILLNFALLFFVQYGTFLFVNLYKHLSAD